MGQNKARALALAFARNPGFTAFLENPGSFLSGWTDSAEPLADADMVKAGLNNTYLASSRQAGGHHVDTGTSAERGA